MAARPQLSYLWLSLVQGGADGFIQTQQSTPIQSAGFAMRIRELTWIWPRLTMAANQQVQLAVSRKSFAAMPALTEKTLVYYDEARSEILTSGAIVWTPARQRVFSEDEAPAIVEPTLYAQFDSNGTGLTSTVVLRVGYLVEKISDVDRLTILANTLAN